MNTSFDKLKSARRCVILCDAPWSLHSQHSRRIILNMAYRRTVDGEKDVEFFIVTDSYFKHALKFLSQHSDFSSGTRERGGVVLVADGKYRLVDYNTKTELIEDVLYPAMESTFADPGDKDSRDQP